LLKKILSENAFPHLPTPLGDTKSPPNTEPEPEEPGKSWVAPLSNLRPPPCHAQEARLEQMRKDRAERERIRKARLSEEVARYETVPLASIEATACYLGGINAKTVRRKIAKGDLEAVTIGSRILVKTASARRLAGLTK
jgi:hypothetical protein